MNRKEIISQIGAAVRNYDPTAETILYGSEARGDARADSDIDILILVDGDHLSPKRAEDYASPLYELEWQTGVPISTMVLLKKDWQHRPITTPFYLNIKNEGIRI